MLMAVQTIWAVMEGGDSSQQTRGLVSIVFNLVGRTLPRAFETPL